MEPKDILRAVAEQQAGYFTAAQATQAGYPDSLHVYHTRAGHWEKVYRGIYRLTSIPKPDWPELVIWSLWSRNRAGEPQLVYSHETADMIHGLLPRRPGPLHVTVPKSFRKNCAFPEDLIVHKEDLDPTQIEERDGYRVCARRPAPRPFSAYDEVINRGED